jgi:small GTP-binding protein
VDTRKICVLGDFATGKTSLVTRLVSNSFGESYHTTVGVRVETKDIVLADGHSVRLAIWDVAGTGTPTELFLRYLRGASGYLLVTDGTRLETFDRALELQGAIQSHLPAIPCLNLVNKADQEDGQEIVDAEITRLGAKDGSWLRTSALTGANVEAAFTRLVERMEPGG